MNEKTIKSQENGGFAWDEFEVPMPVWLRGVCVNQRMKNYESAVAIEIWEEIKSAGREQRGVNKGMIPGLIGGFGKCKISFQDGNIVVNEILDNDFYKSPFERVHPPLFQQKRQEMLWRYNGY